MQWFTCRALWALAVASVVALAPVADSRFAGRVFASQEPPKTTASAPVPTAKTETIATPAPPKPAIEPPADPTGSTAKAQAVTDAQAKLGLSATSLLAVSHDIISGFLQNSLAQNPSMSADELKKKGKDQLTAILAHVANDPNVKLTDVDVKLIEGLAQTIFQTFKLASAVAPPLTAPAAVLPVPPVAASAPALITGKVREFLKDGLVEADAVYKQTTFNNSKYTQMPSAADRKAELQKFVQMKPVGRDGGGTFLDDFNSAAKQKVRDYTQLAPDDQKTVDAMIIEVVDGTSATPTKPDQAAKPQTATTSTKLDVITEVADTALEIVADFVPQFAPFEPLAEGAVNYLIPVLDRWRPLHRLGSRFARRGVFIDNGGSYYAPSSSAVGSRYLIVDP